MSAKASETQLSTGKDRYAVFGNPISHSLSPMIHANFAEQLDQNLSYDKIKVELEDFEKTVSEFFKQGGKGLNITVPFKQRAYAMCESLSDRARIAQAVNTLYIKDNQLHGDNTDGVGMIADLQDYLQWSLENKKVLMLGAGGAAQGVVLPLYEAGVASLTIANRSVEKAHRLVDLLQQSGALKEAFELNACSLDALQDQGEFDVIINATSASLSGTQLILPSTLCSKDSACYDMAYGSEPTVFMQWAQQKGCQRVADGFGMLLEQAAQAFYLWRGVRPSTHSLREQRKAIVL